MLITTSYPQYPGDPSGHFVRAEATALVRRGAEVTVLGPGQPLSEPHGPRTIGLPDLGLFGWPGAIPRLRQRPQRLLGLGRFGAAAIAWLRRAGPLDGVIAHWMVPCGWPVGLASRAPLEVVAHGSDVHLLRRVPALARLVVGQLRAKNAQFRFVSEQLLKDLCAVVGPDLATVSRVELPRIDFPDVPARAMARQQLGLAPETRLVLVVGRLVQGKRLGTALAAATLIPDAQIVVVGDGPLRAPLARRHPSVRFVGRESHQRALAFMAAADVLVTASRAEGAPTVVREARAIGLPVVAAPAGDLARWSATDSGIELVAAHPTDSNDLD